MEHCSTQRKLLVSCHSNPRRTIRCYLTLYKRRWRCTRIQSRRQCQNYSMKSNNLITIVKGQTMKNEWRNCIRNENVCLRIQPGFTLLNTPAYVGSDPSLWKTIETFTWWINLNNICKCLWRCTKQMVMATKHHETHNIISRQLWPHFCVLINHWHYNQIFRDK